MSSLILTNLAWRSTPSNRRNIGWGKPIVSIFHYPPALWHSYETFKYLCVPRHGFPNKSPNGVGIVQDSFPWHLVWNKHDKISQWPKNILSYFSRTTLKELVALQFRLPMFWCGHVVPSNRPHAASLILIGLSLVHVTLKSYFRASFFGMSNRQLHTSCRHLCSRNVFSHDLKLIPS